MGTDQLATALQQIQDLSLRAVFSGSLLLLCCVAAVSLFKNNKTARYFIFLSLIGIVGLVSGVLLATAIYTIQYPEKTLIWVPAL